MEGGLSVSIGAEGQALFQCVDVDSWSDLWSEVEHGSQENSPFISTTDSLLGQEGGII